MKTLNTLVASTALLALPSFASAQTQPPAAGGSDRGAFVLGVKVGGLFPQPFAGRLGAFVVGNVEVGYVLPFLHRGIGVLADVGYTQPTGTGTQMDPRITANGGSYTWNLTQQELTVGLTLVYRLSFIAEGRITPYIGVGPRMWFLRSTVQGTVGTGNTISPTTEQGLRWGLSIPVGLEIAAGPGRVFLEVRTSWSPVDFRITGNSNMGAIDAMLGYRLWL